MLDVAVASMAILLLLPLLIMLVIMVRLSMRGPVFYCHPRIGLGEPDIPLLEVPHHGDEW